jgi:hypothetical protein
VKLIGTMKKPELLLFVISGGVAMTHRGNAKSVLQESIVVGLRRISIKEMDYIGVIEEPYKK